MRFPRVALTLFALTVCAGGQSKESQKSLPKSDDSNIAKSIAESVSGPLQFAEGSFLGMAEAMP